MKDAEFINSGECRFWIKESRYGLWSSYDEEEKPQITALTREACIDSTYFYMEGVRTNWANARTSQSYSGVVGGKL